jgi:hypothetical protein
LLSLERLFFQVLVGQGPRQARQYAGAGNSVRLQVAVGLSPELRERKNQFSDEKFISLFIVITKS